MDQNRKNLLEDAQAVDATARGGTTSKPTGRAHGMARGLTLLTMRVDGEFRLGVKTQQGILDATKAVAVLDMHAPTTVDDLLQNEDGPSLNSLVAAALQSNFAAETFVDEESIMYGPVVTRPEKIVCVGLNYQRHAKEVNLPIPQQPVLFSRFNNSLSGHNHDIQLPIELANKFDYETELLIVMGKNAATSARPMRFPTWRAIALATI